MIGYHAVAVIADAYLKGIRGYDADAGACAPWSPPRPTHPTAGSGRTCSSATCRSTRRARRPPRRSSTPSMTGASRAWRRPWGARDLAAQFFRRAANWRNAYDPASGFMRAPQARRLLSARRSIRPRAATAPTTPRATPGSTPGTCRRMSPGLVRAHGGADKLLGQLDQVFDAKIDPKVFAHMEDITGLIGWYAHGNEPSHHIAYLYAAAGRAVAHAGAARHHHVEPVRAAPGWAGGQR